MDNNVQMCHTGTSNSMEFSYSLRDGTCVGMPAFVKKKKNDTETTLAFARAQSPRRTELESIDHTY